MKRNSEFEYIRNRVKSGEKG